ncbi:MAG: phosphoribosylformylglycinamidine synthase, partial [Oscillospiraceae bacterium]|nr:phosphoribosylformylglycinamidine synthase [Oscillospiraceae bacterium]
MAVYRVYVEKKDIFAIESKNLTYDINKILGIKGVCKVRVINRYDVEGIDLETFEKAKTTIFSEPQVDNYYDCLPTSKNMFASEYLAGQFDQRADSCEQCIQITTCGKCPTVRTAKIFIVEGEISDDEFQKIKSYIINPVECKEASLDKKNTLKSSYDQPTTVKTLSDFNDLDIDGLHDFIKQYGLSMDIDDIKFCKDYFKNVEHRAPTITEIRIIDTYWSDHCRHTTFLTKINDVVIEDPIIAQAFEDYKQIKKSLGREDKPITLMDIATIAAKKLKADGKLNDLDESEEINACSVKIKVDVDGKMEDWLLMFKNETHNHPTEIEPFGGAATCLGGAIRDPLSGRSYVYQAMRVTGAADPLLPIDKTLKGKLPQRKLVTTAAEGYSSYGNQIGIATGHVKELYHPGYVAKRMEIGAVIGAAPSKNVVRKKPQAGDVVVLLGGKTGRDGCGGATGSSKSHTTASLETCGAEVQKGNPPEERKIQRLFRNPLVTRLIKRCNDFGAGGVSVAVGELSDGLDIDLDAIPKKYEGLDGTELAISESQERMAVVIAKKDLKTFLQKANEENLLATKIADVTDTNRLIMRWKGNVIANISREFLNSNGAEKQTNIEVKAKKIAPVNNRKNDESGWLEHLSDLNICSQKGLIERFDSTIGASSVLMPFGGKNQSTETQAMAAKIPTNSETKTASLMAWGFNQYISSQNPFYGAQYAVIESVAKIIAAGGKMEKCWLTFQEYFQRTQNDPKRWGQPFSALLGSLNAQIGLKIGSIGGKDSMSGTFENIDVPPTLVSFAVSVTNADDIISTEFKAASNEVALLIPKYKEDATPDYEDLIKTFSTVQKLIEDGSVISAWAVGYGGVSEAITKMCFGNRLGFVFEKDLDNEILFNPIYGGFVLELKNHIQGLDYIGHTTNDYLIKQSFGSIDIAKLENAYNEKLDMVYPTKNNSKSTFDIPTLSYKETVDK